MLWGCGIYSNTGLSFIELSDDAALEYSMSFGMQKGPLMG